jgi:septum formation inhibitor MinC
MSITPFVGIPCSIHVTEKKILINNPHRLDLVELSQNFSKGIYKFKKKLHCQDYKIEYAKSINEEEVERFVEETKESIRFMEFANNTAEILKTFKRNHILQFKKFIYDLSIKQ